LSPDSCSSWALQTLQTSAKLNLSFYEKRVQQTTWGRSLNWLFLLYECDKRRGRGGAMWPAQTWLIFGGGVGCRQTPTTTTPPASGHMWCDVGRLASSSNPFSLFLHTYDKISPNALLGTIIIKAQNAQANPPMCLCTDNTYLMPLTCIY
jgi:hypothetical protein